MKTSRVHHVAHKPHASASLSAAEVSAAKKAYIASVDSPSRPPRIPSSNVPPAIRAPYRWYLKTIEDRSFLYLSARPLTFGGHKVYELTVTSDGDDRYFELYSATGKPIASGHSALNSASHRV